MAKNKKSKKNHSCNDNCKKEIDNNKESIDNKCNCSSDMDESSLNKSDL